MEIAFVLKKLVTLLILPPFNLLAIAIIGLIVAKRRPRIGRILTGTSLVGILLLATPAVANLLMQSIAVESLGTAAGKDAKAIVVLGGGLRLNTPEYGTTLSSLALERVRYGAIIAKQTGLPILVSGGVVFQSPPEAEIMAKVLEDDFNVTVRWIENQSRDTAENLRLSAPILQREQIGNVFLVTQDFHMRRALAECRATGLNCIPAAVSLHGRGEAGPWFYELPNASSLETSVLALHEIFGLLAVALSGN